MALSLTWLSIQVLSLPLRPIVDSLSFSLTLILFRSVLTLRLRIRLRSPIGITASITLDY